MLLPDHLFSKTIDNLDLFTTPITGRENGGTENKTVAKQIRLKTMRILTMETLALEGDTELLDKIKKSTELDDIVTQSLETIQKSGPRSIIQGLKDWNLEEV